MTATIESEKAKIGIIVLAAGSSSRMKGEAKQALEFENQTLLRRAAHTALCSVCHPIIVVLGANAAVLRKEIEDLPGTIVFNRDWQQGISSSIKTGLTKLLKIAPETKAVIISLCDQPLITANVFKQLIEIHQSTGKQIVASEYENTVGVPALFAREMFDELMNLSGDTGAKYIIKKHINSTAKISVPAAALDIDSLKDYERLLRI